MATQTVTYMNILSDHAVAIKCYPESEIAYQRIIQQKRVLPPETKWPLLDNEGQDNLRRRMDAIVHRPAISAEE